MLMRALKMAFWVTYDHLGKLLVANVCAMLVLMVPLGFAYGALVSGDPGILLLGGVPALIVAFGVVVPVLAAGLAYMVKEFIDTRDGSLLTMLEGIRRYGWRAVRIGLVFVAGIGCLLVSAWFYASRLGATMPWLGYGLSAIALWCTVLAGLAALLVLPTLVQKQAGVLASIKLSLLLVLDNPLFAVGLAMNVGCLVLFALVPPVFFAFSIAPVVVVVTSAYEILARKYAFLEAAKAAGDGGDGGRRPAIDFQDETDDYLSRGFRDFLFPWKG